MNVSTLNRLATTVAISAALTTISIAAHAQLQPQFSYLWEAEANQGKQDEMDNGKARQQQQRLSKQQQQERIRQQQENLALYRKNIELRQAIAKQDSQLLQQQKRMAHYRFQQTYYGRLGQQQAQLPDDRHDFNKDPFYYTAPNYRYRRDGRSYETNQYGANILRQAANTGYQEGVQAGRADKQDKWRSDFKQSFAYKDANYGYGGRYVSQDDYNYYFREGFQRGYEDGYNDSQQYGASTNGSDFLLTTVLNAILNLESMR
jgi:hypothetical protein